MDDRARLEASSRIGDGDRETAIHLEKMGRPAYSH
jgi:hypothetical protein